MDNRERNISAVFLLSGGLTFSWLIVWASFTTAPILGRRFPLIDALLTFTAAAATIAWARGRRWRNYQFVALHMIGLIFFVLFTLYFCFFSEAKLFSMTWLSTLGVRLRDVHGFLTVLLVAGWTAAFWFCGVQLGRRPPDFLLVCNRFDAGLTGLFALLLVQLVLVVRGNLTIAAPPDVFYMYTFFLCGLLAIGLVRYRSMARKQFLPGFRGVAILITFAAAILATTALLAVLAPPILTPVAEDGYEFLRTAAKPVEAILVRVVRFLFGRDVDYSLGPEGALSSPSELLPDETNAGGVWVARLLAEGFVGVLAIALLALVGYLIWRLVRWLFYRKADPPKPWRPLALIVELILKMWAWLQYCGKALHILLTSPRNIGRLFAALQAWGRVSGIRHRDWETPQEFASRLSMRFPQTANEIDIIVGAFQNQIYGERTPDSNTITNAYTAWHKLRSPMLWPSRWRALFDRPRAPR